MIGPFSIDAFDPKESQLLGEGLWGRVYDLGDGTVLKLAREACAGIGNGREKIQREYEALTLLVRPEGLEGLIPRTLGRGDLPPGLLPGFAVWLRTTRIEGDPLSSSAIESATLQDQHELGASIGETLARLHRALKELESGRLGIRDGRVYAELREAVGCDPLYLESLAILEAERSRIPPDRVQICHNDYNISNLLFAGQKVCGLLDFAETGLGYPEKDISDTLSEIPCLEEPLIRSYQLESGMKLDPNRIVLGVAENALYSAVISERLGDLPGVKCGRELLARQLEKLGFRLINS